MKGIILAGGLGSRLYPLTKTCSKQLLPVHDKPMIYYSLSMLMLAGIRDIAIISSERDLPQFMQLLDNGEQVGCNFTYIVQKEPKGIAQAFLLAESFLQNDAATLILGDNIFFGDGLPGLIQRRIQVNNGATVFAYPVNNPRRYGVVECDTNGKAISIEEKPQQPKSRYAVTGLYIYDNKVCEYAKSLTPSARGELEITDLNRCYLTANQLQVERLGRGVAWLDAGTATSLYEASQFIEVIESRQGFKVACIEEIAYRMQFIDLEQLERLADTMPNSDYSQYLRSFCLSEQQYA